MAKLVLTDIASLENQTTAIQAMADNNQAIETALENTLSRDGTSPNEMGADLDMNSNRITNLPPPVSGSEPARFVDLTEALAVDSVIPALSGNTGKLLSNDGSVLAWASNTALLPANNLSDLASTSTARTNLGLGTAAVEAIGTSGNAIGKLNTDLTWSGTQSWAGTQTWTGGGSFGGSADYRLTATPTSLNSDSIGYRAAPFNTQDATYTLVLLDSGKTVAHSSGSAHAWTIPPNSSVAFPIGTVILVYNSGAGAVTLTRGSGVALRFAGSSTDANFTLAQWGMGSLTKVGTDSWVVNGAGVT